MDDTTTRRTRVLVGLVTIGLAVVAVVGLRLMTSGDDRSVDKGVSALLNALDARDVSARRQAFDKAERAFSQAMRGSLFDSYPPFLLHLTSLLRDGAPLPPQPTLFERAVLWVATNRIEDARRLLEERPEHLRDDGERYLLRFLSDARALSQSCTE